MEQTTQNIVDFNKICRTCLSTENLQPITGFMLADITSIQKGKEEIYIYGCTIQSVLNKYAHIEFDLSDLLPKQICSNCFVKLNNAYTFLKHCYLMNTALMDCLTRVGKSQANVCEEKVENSEMIKTEIQETNHFKNTALTNVNTSQSNVANSLDSEIKNEIPETTHFKNTLAECLTHFENNSQANVCEKNDTHILDLEIPKTKIHKINHLNNTALTDNTAQANVCEQNIANNLDLNTIKSKIHKATHFKSNDSEIDYETEIPMSKIPSHVEKIFRAIRTTNITEKPKVVIETFNENCMSEECELIQENNDRIHFENEIQIISDDDSNSGDPLIGQKSVVELKSELRKLLTDKGPPVNKKCKLCRKEFRKKTVNKFHSYCECFPRF